MARIAYIVGMISFITKAPRSRRTLIFGSTMHVWSDLFFALLVPLLPFIKEDMGLSFTEAGLLRSVFSGASAFLQVPAGFLAESVGEFWLLTLGNVWVSAGLVGMALSPVFIALVVVSGVGGLGGGMQHPLASSMVSRAYDDKGRATAVGTVNFAGDIGKMIAPLVAGLLAVSMGWRATFFAVGLAGLAFMLASMFARRAVDIGRPRQSEAAPSEAESTETESETKMAGFIALSGVGLLDSATRTSALVFLPFVMESKGMGPGQISVALFLLFGGGAIGKYVCGWLGDRTGTLILVWLTKGITAALLVVSLFTPVALIAPLMALIGIGLNGTSSALYATVAEFAPPGRRARFYGFFYTTNEVGTVVAPLIYGLVADVFSLYATMLAMGAATLSILPASLTLRRHLERAGF